MVFCLLYQHIDLYPKKVWLSKPFRLCIRQKFLEHFLNVFLSKRALLFWGGEDVMGMIYDTDL